MKHFLEQVTHEPTLQGYTGVSQAKLRWKRVRHSKQRGQYQQRHGTCCAEGLEFYKECNVPGEELRNLECKRSRQKLTHGGS